MNPLVRLGQRPNALGAQHLLDLAAVFDDGHLLQVRPEGTVRIALGERNCVAENGCLTTMSTLCHMNTSFLCFRRN